MSGQLTLTLEVPAELLDPAGGELSLVVSGIEQRGPSHELRVFACHPQADASTPRTADSGYLGSIFVYGYGLDEGPDPGGADPPSAALPMVRVLRLGPEAWPPRGCRAGAGIELTFVAVLPGQAPGTPGLGPPRVEQVRLERRR